MLTGARIKCLYSVDLNLHYTGRTLTCVHTECKSNVSQLASEFATLVLESNCACWLTVTLGQRQAIVYASGHT